MTFRLLLILLLIYKDIEKVSPGTDEKYEIVFCPFIHVYLQFFNETDTRTDKNISHNGKTRKITLECLRYALIYKTSETTCDLIA